MNVIIDAFVALFPSLVSVAIFCIGMVVTKDKNKRKGWWIAGVVIFALYAFGNLTSANKNYYSVAIGVIVLLIFYFVMMGKKKYSRVDYGMIIAVLCAIVAVTCIIIGSYRALN